MSHLYYYFAASLPLLHFEGKPPMSTRHFLEECVNNLHGVDYKTIAALFEYQPIESDNRVVKYYLQFDHDFRRELAVFRAQRANKDVKDFLRAQTFTKEYFQPVIAQAAALSLLEAEKVLAKFRWDFLSKLETGYYFSFENVFIYALKLQIVERFDRIEHSGQGQEIYRQLKSVHV